MISNYYLWTIKIYNSWAVRFGFGFETRSLLTIIWIVDANNTREHNKQKNRNIAHLLIHVTTCIMDCSVDTIQYVYRYFYAELVFEENLCVHVPQLVIPSILLRKSRIGSYLYILDDLFDQFRNNWNCLESIWCFMSDFGHTPIITEYFYWFIDRWCGKVNKYNSSSTKNHFVEKEIEHLIVYCIATFFTLLLLLWRCERYFYGDWSLCFVLLFGVISFVIDASQQNTNYRLCQRRWNSH